MVRWKSSYSTPSGLTLFRYAISSLPLIDIATASQQVGPADALPCHPGNLAPCVYDANAFEFRVKFNTLPLPVLEECPRSLPCEGATRRRCLSPDVTWMDDGGLPGL
jgi:hypothetical protein